MTKANAGDQNFGHRHLNILNRYSLCNNPCRSHRHLLVHGSRKDFSRLQYKRCHLLRPNPTSNRHSKHPFGYSMFFEHQSIGVGLCGCNHIQSSLSSSYRLPVPFLHRYHCLHKPGQFYFICFSKRQKPSPPGTSSG